MEWVGTNLPLRHSQIRSEAEDSKRGLSIWATTSQFDAAS